MAEAAEATPPAPVSMKQAFEQAVSTVEQKALPAGEEQGTKPVQGSEQETTESKGKPTDQPAKQESKSQPTEEKAAQMRMADYTRKTQELAREREALREQVSFAEAWGPTAEAYHRAAPEVQAQIKSLLETGKATSTSSGKPAALPSSGRIEKLLNSFQGADRETVQDLLATVLEEAEERISKKYGELDRKIEDKSKTIEQEASVRQQRDAENAWAEFDRACPEWRELSERQVQWFQRDILSDPNIDPIKHFKENFLPELGSRAKKEATDNVNKILNRAGQAVPRGGAAPAAQGVKKFTSMRDAFEEAAREKGF